MQYKKSLLQRLLVIYITFFIVIVASFAHGLLPGFSRGFSEGSELGKDIVKSWESGTPRLIYMLGDIPVHERDAVVIGNTGASDLKVKARVSNLTLTVEQSAPDASVMGLAFSSVGGRPWMYALVMLGLFFFIAIIVLMFLIIHSLRRSIREERTLDKRNVWLLRTIGLLTILMELFQDIVNWCMARRAAELLTDSPYMVDTGFHVSYTTIIMGILILFAAEVFAIGQNLSEEQKLTI